MLAVNPLIRTTTKNFAQVKKITGEGKKNLPWCSQDGEREKNSSEEGNEGDRTKQEEKYVKTRQSQRGTGKGKENSRGKKETKRKDKREVLPRTAPKRRCA